MIRRSAAALLLACAACRADQPHHTVPAAPAPPPPYPHALHVPAVPVVMRPPRHRATPVADSAAPAPVRHPEPPPYPLPAHPAGYLVWAADSANGAETVWLDTAGLVVASRPGVYVAAGPHLWRWVDGQKRVTQVDCDCFQQHENDDHPPSCLHRVPTGISYLVDLTAGARRVEVLKAQSDRDWATLSQSAWPLAGAGPYLVTRAEGDYDGCGAHDLPGAWQSLYDLAHARELQVHDTAGVYERDSAASVAAFAAMPSGMPEDEAGPGGLDDYEFHWTPGGRLQGGYRFQVWACFACSDSGLSYGRTALVVDPVLPRWLRPWSRAPEPVRTYWRMDLRGRWRDVDAWTRADPASATFWFGRETLKTGWSAVDAADADAMLRAFTAPDSAALGAGGGARTAPPFGGG